MRNAQSAKCEAGPHNGAADWATVCVTSCRCGDHPFLDMKLIATHRSMVHAPSVDCTRHMGFAPWTTISMFFHGHLTVMDMEAFPTGAAVIHPAGAYRAADMRVAAGANVVVGLLWSRPCASVGTSRCVCSGRRLFSHAFARHSRGDACCATSCRCGASVDLARHAQRLCALLLRCRSCCVVRQTWHWRCEGLGDTRVEAFEDREPSTEARESEVGARSEATSDEQPDAAIARLVPVCLRSVVAEPKPKVGA